MEVVHTRLEKAATKGRAIVAAGFFDGLHIGHQAVLGEALAEASIADCEAWVLTFKTHPRSVLSPDAAMPLLMSQEERIEAFSKMGFDGVCLIDFDAGIATLGRDEFVARLHKVFPQLSSLVCGANWRFGNKGTGTPEFLAGKVERAGWGVKIVQTAILEGVPVSSTRIRAAVAMGDFIEASFLLGRPYSIAGIVVHDRCIGSAAGIPTANISTDGLAIPPLGVYAVDAVIEGDRYIAVANLGWRPTFENARPKAPMLEVHLLDAKRDLYGRRLEAIFLKRLRDEIKFTSERALFAQIANDIAAVRALDIAAIRTRMQGKSVRR